MILLSMAMFVGLVVLAIAIAGWLHVGCLSCSDKV